MITRERIEQFRPFGHCDTEEWDELCDLALRALEAERAAASVEKSFEPSESDVRAAAAESGVDVNRWNFVDGSVCVGEHEKHEACVYRSFEEAIGILRARKAGR